MIETEYHAPGLQGDVSKKGMETQLDGLVVASRLQEVLEGKNYKNLDMVLPFLVRFID